MLTAQHNDMVAHGDVQSSDRGPKGAGSNPRGVLARSNSGEQKINEGRTPPPSPQTSREHQKTRLRRDEHQETVRSRPRAWRRGEREGS